MNLNLVNSVLLAGVVPVVMATPAIAQVQSVTDIQIIETETGLEVVLDTLGDEPLETFIIQEGNSAIANIPNAQLAIPGGEFRQLNPVAGITEITAVNIGTDSVQIRITGETGIPQAEVVQSSQGLVLSVTPLAEMAEIDDIEEIELVVTATRTAQAPEDVPRSITIVDRQQLENQANLTSNLGDILGQVVPGFGPPNQANRANAQTLRGRDAQILIDGVPQRSNGSVSVQLQYIDPSSIERIEVVRGPSAIYGGEATGGVINIITRQPEGERLTLITEVGVTGALGGLEENSLGTEFRQSIFINEEDVDFVGNLSLTNTGEFYDAEGDIIAPNNTALSNTQSFNLLAKLGFNFDEDRRLQFTVNHAEDNRDLDFIAAGNPDPNKEKAVALPRNVVFVNTPFPRISSTSANVLYRHDDIFGSSLQAQAYYRTSEQSTIPFPGGRNFPPFINSNDEEVFGGRLQIETPIARTAEVLWGLDIERQRNGRNRFIDLDANELESGRAVKTVEFIGYPDYDLNSLGFFAQGQWDITEDWAALGGIRYERFTFKAGNFTNFNNANITGGEADFDDVLFNAGTVYDVTENISVFANFSQGFSAPDFDNLLQSVQQPLEISAGFRDLQPQKVDEYEIGIRGNWDRVQASIAAFYNYSELGTRLVEVPNNNFLVLRREPQRNYGVEATLDVEATENLRVGGIFSWTEGEFEDRQTQEFLPLGRFDIQPLKLTAYVEHETLPGWTNRLQMLYVGNRDRAFKEKVDPVDIDGYFLIDYLSNIQLGQGELQIGIQNLFNNQYFPVYSQALLRPIDRFAGQGRTVSVRYRMEW
ncbi:MAG: TonB-dependent receptor domain-containing protein [Spirulinaceae cyanobacterium]